MEEDGDLMLNIIKDVPKKKSKVKEVNVEVCAFLLFSEFENLYQTYMIISFRF